ncbi:MAG: DUF1810 domain-containing protein [Edaphobacter sp.]
MNDPYNLQRFLDAQKPVFNQVCAELRAGRKTGHWMWFIFPQLRGLGSSETAQFFAIGSLEEATQYLRHTILGPRLRECSRLVTAVQERTVDEILGYPDNLKLKSSMTLFAHASDDNQIFIDVLNRHFDSQYDAQTMARL